MKKKIIQFGAGNIGRSFTGQVFAENGYEVVFVDINKTVIDAINDRGKYSVIIKENDSKDKEILVRHIRGIYSDDTAAVVREIVDATILITSVGKNALQYITPTIALGIAQRFSQQDAPVLNIILAENMLHGREVVTTLLKSSLADQHQLLKNVGIIETSIGKMVPIMPKEVTEKDPLIVYGEAYDTLIIDKAAYLGPIPEIPQIKAVDPISAYVDRKLYIHNLGHAAVAYLGYLLHPEYRYLYEALQDPALYQMARQAMSESAQALVQDNPGLFTIESMDDHIDDLLYRFSNRALRDTIYRVGRDLPRKLHRHDRIIGAMLLCSKYNLPFDTIRKVFMAGLLFNACDEQGNRLPQDEQFIAAVEQHGTIWALENLCKLNPEDPLDAALIAKISER